MLTSASAQRHKACAAPLELLFILMQTQQAKTARGNLLEAAHTLLPMLCLCQATAMRASAQRASHPPHPALLLAAQQEWRGPAHAAIKPTGTPQLAACQEPFPNCVPSLLVVPPPRVVLPQRPPQVNLLLPLHLLDQPAALRQARRNPAERRREQRNGVWVGWGGVGVRGVVC